MLYAFSESTSDSLSRRAPPRERDRVRAKILSFQRRARKCRKLRKMHNCHSEHAKNLTFPAIFLKRDPSAIASSMKALSRWL